MIPAMICAVPPNAMASGITTGSPAGRQQAGIDAAQKNGGKPEADQPQAARGLRCLPSHCLPDCFCCETSLGRIQRQDTRFPGGGRNARPTPAPGSRSARRRPGAPSWRISSSISTGAGPSASSTAARMRSASASSAASAGQARHARDPARESRGPGWAQAPPECPRRFRSGWRHRGSGRLVPLARGSSGEPGTAKISRPCSSAYCAVISEPERLRRFHHHHAARQAGDDAVAAREVARLGGFAQAHFRHDRRLGF